MTQPGSASPPAPSLLDEARGLIRRRGGVCAVEMFYVHRPDLAAELREAMAATEITSDAIAKAVKRRYSVEISEYTIQRHRRRACKCPG